MIITLPPQVNKALFGLAVAMTSLVTSAQANISLYYVDERPPYFVKEGSILKGTAASPTTQALTAAGIGYEWVKRPATRLLMDLKDTDKPACAPSYFKTAERESWGRFSVPILRDSPQVLLASKHFSPNSTKLSEVLANKTNRLLIKQSFSYGSGVDRLLEELKPNISSVTVEIDQMIKMISAERADFMFIAPEEYDAAVKKAEGSAVKMLKFEDTPLGEYRYILCNKNVSADTLRKINAAIAFKP